MSKEYHCFKRPKWRRSSFTVSDFVNGEDDKAVTPNVLKSDQLFTPTWRRAEEMAQLKHSRIVTWCKIYEKRPSKQFIEDDMATSEEDDSSQTKKRKRIEVRWLSFHVSNRADNLQHQLLPIEWKHLDAGVQLDILHNLICDAKDMRRAAATLHLNRAERQSAVDLLSDYDDFHQRAMDAVSMFSQAHTQHETQLQRVLSHEEIRELMRKTILAVDGEERFDKPVKECDIQLGRQFLRERRAHKDLISLKPDLSPRNPPRVPRSFEANLSPHLSLAYRQGPMAFPSLPLNTPKEQIRNAPRRSPGSFGATPGITILADSRKNREY